MQRMTDRGVPTPCGHTCHTIPALKTQRTSGKKGAGRLYESKDQEVFCEIVSPRNYMEDVPMKP